MLCTGMQLSKNHGQLQNPRHQRMQSADQAVHLQWSNRVGAVATGAPELDVALQGARVERIPRTGARILAVHSIGAESRFFWCALIFAEAATLTGG